MQTYNKKVRTVNALSGHADHAECVMDPVIDTGERASDEAVSMLYSYRLSLMHTLRNWPLQAEWRT